jgi:hypothetical protein
MACRAPAAAADYEQALKGTRDELEETKAEPERAQRMIRRLKGEAPGK